MNTLNTWGDTITLAFQNVWTRVISFLPDLVAAIIILIIGLLIAYALSALVYKLIEATRIDTHINKVGMLESVRRAGVDLSIANITAQIVKWFFIIVTIIAVADALKLPQINNFLESVVMYIPNVIVAIIILGLGLVIGQFVGNLVEKSKTVMNMQTAFPLGSIAKWAIVIFALMAALVQLNIAASLIQILFTGLVLGTSLAFGLAFGLGGRDKAARLLDQSVDKGRELKNRADQNM